MLPEGAVKISGGTVLAANGDGDIVNLSDLIMSGNANSTSDVGTDTSFQITGGSIHGANLDVKPNPVDADGTPLRYLLFTNMTAGAAVSIASSDIPATYGMNDVVVDPSGSVCLWLPKTNAVRIVSGLNPASAAIVDASGDALAYLPDGEYAFTVDGSPWAVSVLGAPAVAHRVIGVSVNEYDVGFLQGEGWSYNITNGVLELSAEGPFVLSGTNTQGRVRVRVETNAAVTISNLWLRAAANRCTPFAVASNVTAKVWFTGENTLEAGRYCAALEVPGVTSR